MDELEHDRLSSVRIDVWLWSVRLSSTRSAATELCRNGRVTLNAATAKAASTVKVGDRVEARIEQRQRIVVVSQLINKRVGSPIAVRCFEDHSPAIETAENLPVLHRDRGTGRPTKSDRRKIDQLRGRS